MKQYVITIEDGADFDTIIKAVSLMRGVHRVGAAVDLNEIREYIEQFIGHDICRKTRKIEVVQARQVAHAIAAALNIAPRKDIAWEIGKLDGITIINSKLRVSNNLETDKNFVVKWAPVIEFFKLNINDLIIKN